MKCPILSQCETEIDVLEWVYAKRQGTKKGKQNTQLEIGHSRQPVKDILLKMAAKLEVARLHQAHYEWRDTMRKIDLTMSDPNKHRIFCTDFGATLDLMGAEKDNSSVNNHAIVDIFFVAHSWRHVPFKKPNGEGPVICDRTIVNDCDKWIFFGDTYSKGKKNDHVFHNAYLTHIIKYYDRIRATDNKAPIPVNVVWTDNCPG